MLISATTEDIYIYIYIYMASLVQKHPWYAFFRINGMRKFIFRRNTFGFGEI